MEAASERGHVVPACDCRLDEPAAEEDRASDNQDPHQSDFMRWIVPVVLFGERGEGLGGFYVLFVALLIAFELLLIDGRQPSPQKW